jgi:thioredoxin 1
MSKFNELINGEQPVLVDFSAIWCGPCKVMEPILSETAAKLKGKAKIIKVDIDKNPEAANKYGIRSVPTLLLFKKGEIIWQQSGVVPANQLLAVIEKFV